MKANKVTKAASNKCSDLRRAIPYYIYILMRALSIVVMSSKCSIIWYRTDIDVTYVTSLRRRFTYAV